MRHLELPPQSELDCEVKSECSIEIKDEDLDLDIKEELIGLPIDVGLQSYDEVTKLNSEDESENDGNLASPKSESSNSSVAFKGQNVKQSRRKSAQPKRSVQNARKKNVAQTSKESDYEPEEGEEDKELEDENIFKGLQEEIGEDMDEEMQRNVKEEWKAHWGIKCNMCEKIFTHKVNFDKHYRSTYNTRPIYTCSYCNKSMEKYSTFRSHCYRHITEGRYKCQTCNKGFSLQSMLHVHILAKHTDVKPFICEECGKGFVTKPGLKIHLKKHRTGTKEDYPCVECGKILHTRGGLSAHMNVHRLGRRFMCDMCGKTFTQKVNMQQHVKHHNGERPYSCDKCGKTFAEKSHLARHYSFHSEKRPFKCEVCQKMYKTERCLKVHSMVHATSRPFVCTYCGKGFLSSTKLKQHYNIHTGERPFKCKYCERSFTNYPNWLKHTRRRHKVDHRTGLGLVPKEEETPAVTPATTPAPTTVDPLPIEDMSNFVMDYHPEDVIMADMVQLQDTRMGLEQENMEFITGMNGNNVMDFQAYLQQTQLQNFTHQAILDAQNLIPQYSEQMLHTHLVQQQMLM